MGSSYLERRCNAKFGRSILCCRNERKSNERKSCGIDIIDTYGYVSLYIYGCGHSSYDAYLLVTKFSMRLIFERMLAVYLKIFGHKNFNPKILGHENFNPNIFGHENFRIYGSSN